MTVFKFDACNQYSQTRIECVRAWLSSRPNMEWARDMQNEPDSYYKGDILLKRYHHQPEYMEVKAETRASTTTPNLAIEQFSKADEFLPGGPWGTTADYYAHVFDNGLLCIMHRRNLISYLTPKLPSFRPFSAQNEDWITTGVLVPRVQLSQDLGTLYREYKISETSS